MIRATISGEDRRVILALVLFALFFRLATIMMINTGVDERDYWQSARALSHGLPYPELSHRTTRYGVILPVAAAQLVLGVHPNVYYVLPVLNCMLQAALAYLLGLRLRGRLTGLLFSLALILFPYMIRAGSQVRPEIFSITYMLLALMYFCEYMNARNDSFRPLLWSAMWIFVSYETKIDNLFLVPGLLFAMLLYKRRVRHAVSFAGILFGLFVIETVLYAVFTTYRFGELEIIMQKHFSAGSFTVPRLIDLLQRYAPENLQPYWSVPFAIFGIGSIAYLSKGRDLRIKSLILGALSFFFFITIAVKSLHPIIPAEDFINRYFSVVLVPVFLTLAFMAEGAARRVLKTGRALAFINSPRVFIALVIAGFLGTTFVFSMPFFPERLRQYAHSPFDLARHPFALNERYWQLVNEAYTGGIPIVGSHGLAGISAIMTSAGYYLSIDLFKEGRPPEPLSTSWGGSNYWIISETGTLGKTESVLVVRRMPFQAEYMPLSELSRLSEGLNSKSDE
jgi:hypothetical protein